MVNILNSFDLKEKTAYIKLNKWDNPEGTK